MMAHWLALSGQVTLLLVLTTLNWALMATLTLCTEEVPEKYGDSGYRRDGKGTCH